MSKKSKATLKKAASLKGKNSPSRRSSVLSVLVMHQTSKAALEHKSARAESARARNAQAEIAATENVSLPVRLGTTFRALNLPKVSLPDAAASRRLLATFLLSLLLVAQVLFCAATFAQTKPSPSGPAQSAGSQQPSGQARNTEDTVPNPYADAIGQTGQVDQASNVNTFYMGQGAPRDPMEQIRGNVDKILTGEYTNVVFQAAEQGQGGDVQKIANNVLNASLGSINDSYRGLHKWFQDDIVGNLFSNIGQLIGKWISEIINGWIADSVQFLAQFLRVFVLNPNVAVNGLNGSQNDGISPYVRQGADVMYGIAVDLLLLLFILAIWKYWAEASYRGAGNLMGAVGRLIFTAGLLLAWPTIYAFEVQISNEMIKAIYFNTNDQVAMLHYALASAVKGGVIAAGAAATSVFAPILGNLALGAAGPMVGSVFYFASMVIFLILGGILIAELIYILVLKAIQTALLVAQYMFAPVFLVFFATPDTENIATGYVRAFVETSLWTFVWVGLLKIMVIIMFSNFNPWGKILIAIGVLQLMIQVPAFLARAQISPMSDFISAGLVTGGILKGLAGLGGLVSGGLNTMIGMSMSKKQAEDLYSSKNVPTGGIGAPPGDPKHLEALNKASQTGREYDWSKDKPTPGGTPTIPGGPGTPPGTVPPPVKTPGSTSTTGTGASAVASAVPQAKPNLHGAAGPDPAAAHAAGKPLDPAAGGAPGTTTGTGAAGGPAVPPPKPAAKPGAGLGTAAAVAGLGAAALAAAQTQPKDNYSWGKSTAEGWDEKGLINVDTRKFIGQLTSVDGTGIRHDQPETSILGSTRAGVTRLNIGKGAEGPELARAIYTAGFTNNVSRDPAAADAARSVASEQQAWKPQGFKQGLIGNWLEAHGQSWYSTPWAKENFNKAMFAAAVDGSKSYVSGQQGNAYTAYLRGRYGEWDEKQDAMAAHLISNPDSSESPWNRNIGPATDGLIRAGIPIGMDTRGAMQNMTIQGMHPARQKKAVLATLSYTYDKAKELFGSEDPAALALGHGELAKSLPANMVNEAISIYEASGSQADLKPQYGGYVSSLSGSTRQDMATSYQALAVSAPHVAASLGRLRANVDPRSIHTISDLEANVVPAAGETRAQAFQAVMETTANGLSAGEMHSIPMKMVMNPEVGRGIFEYMGSDIADTNSAQAHRKMRVISQNLRVVGTANDANTYQAIETVLMAGGPMLSGADDINMAKQLIDAGVAPASLPGAVSMAVRGGYHLSSTPVPIDTIVEAANLDAGGAQMNAQKIRLVGRLLDAGISRDLLPQALDVTMRGGYASQASLPVDEITKVAEQYNMGMVSDTRYVPAVAMAVRSGVGNINNQTVRIIAEACADLGGYQNANDQYVKAVIRASGTLQNPNIAPSVMETYVRSSASNAGISGADNLPLQDVLSQLEPTGFDISKAPMQIASIQRDGAFSAYQLQDPVAVNLILQHAGGGPAAMQAVNVVTRLYGSEEASGKADHIEVAQECISSGGKTRDFDVSSLEAAVQYAAMRDTAAAADPATYTGDVLKHLKLTPGVMKAVSRDYSSSGNQITQAGFDRLVQEAIKRATAGPRP